MTPSNAGHSAIRCVPAAELDVQQFHDLLKLRVDIFVVEQECPYPELDGRDLEPGTTHFWIDDASGIVAYIRLLSDPDGFKIGRVATRSDARGKQLAKKLMEAIHQFTGSSNTMLDAQSYLGAWYQSFGYEASGPEFIEDGIPHIPMKRMPANSSSPSTDRNEP